MPIQQGYPSRSDKNNKQSSQKKGSWFNFCKSVPVPVTTEEYHESRFFVLKHEMLDVPAVFAKMGETTSGWHALTYQASGRTFAPIYGGPCHDSDIFWCLWEAMPGAGGKEIVECLDNMIGADIMKNTATEISTENSWFPGPPPFTLPRSPLDPVENQKSFGQFAFVRCYSEDPEARAAKIGAYMSQGEEVVNGNAVQTGVFCHYCLHEIANKETWSLWEVDAAIGKGKDDIEAFMKKELMPEGTAIDIYMYNMPLVPNLPSAIFAKNGTDYTNTDHYALLATHSANSPDALRNFTNSPFCELLERHGTDMGCTRYFSMQNTETNTYNTIIEGSEAAIDKIQGLSEHSGWLLDDFAKPISGPLNLTKMKCIQHCRWVRTQEDLVDYGIGGHGVSDPQLWLETFNSPHAGILHKSRGIAETMVYFETDRTAIYVIHKVLPGQLERFKEKFSQEAMEETVEKFVQLGMPVDLIQRPFNFEYCNILARKTLGLRANPAPLRQKFSIITECVVSDVDAVVKQFEAMKQMYQMNGFEEFNILKDLENPKHITLYGTFSDTTIVDRFKNDPKDESDFAKLYLPAGAENYTVYITRQTEKYGWSNNKRRVGEYIGYFRFGTKSAKASQAFRASEKYQNQIQGYNVACVIPNSQLFAHGQAASLKACDDQHIFLCFPQQEHLSKMHGLMKLAQENLDAVPFLKKANEMGMVLEPLIFWASECIAVL